MTLLIITDALMVGEGEAVASSFTLHPALDVALRTDPALKRLARMRRQWFRCPDHNPLGCYARIVDAAPAALLAARCLDVPAAARQAWVASPYYAMLGRDSVRLLPESEFPWTAEDADWLAGELNPLLAEEGMHLHVADAAMMLSMQTPIEASPAPFGEIAGGLLPNRHPEGVDGGRLMRLLAEIQMHLHHHPQPTREGYPAVSGLWLWGRSALPQVLPDTLPTVSGPDAGLEALHHDHAASITLCDAGRLETVLADAVSADGLPRHVLLGGGGHAVLLKASLIPSLPTPWKVRQPGSEAELLSALKRIVHAG